MYVLFFFLTFLTLFFYYGTFIQTVHAFFFSFLPWNISTNSACFFFLPWNISTNCMFFFPLGHFYNQPLFYYFSWIFYSIISVSNFVLCLCFYLQQIFGARVEACWFTVQHQIRYWQHHFCEAWWISGPCSSQQVKGEDVHVFVLIFIIYI